jgi:hypothetical protein
MSTGGRDWHAWHAGYETDPHLQRRLATVQARMRDALDAQPPGPINIVSACGGQARDVIGAVTGHPRAADVHARVVELDAQLAHTARINAAAAGLTGIDVNEADAGTTSSYEGAVPAAIVLMCGIFGNVTDADVEQTIRTLPSFCAPGAQVIWTRHRMAPDFTPTIRAWFTREGFSEIAFDAPDDTFFAVGTNRYDGAPAAFPTDTRLFTFVDSPNAPGASAPN